MQRFHIFSANYWRDISCVFLRSEQGELHLASVLPEGFTLFGAMEIGLNRFLVAQSDRVDFWDLNEGIACHLSPSIGDAWRKIDWYCGATVSPDGMWAAMSADVPNGGTSFLVFDLRALKVIEISGVQRRHFRSLFVGIIPGTLEPIMVRRGKTDGDRYCPAIREVDDNGRLTISNGRHEGAPQIVVDPRTKEIQATAESAITQERLPLPPGQWGEPASEEASSMPVSMPVPMVTRQFAYQLCNVD